ncbi:hypothetical protein, partial [uncultured Helicobacter sp.]|uniref:hypothetical protein n=1 Tax=uncultured Helicobacter sp. TaxID=175537 RepID=UPI00262029AE
TLFKQTHKKLKIINLYKIYYIFNKGGGDAMEAVDKTNEMEAKLYAKFESICRKIPYPQNTSYRDMNEQERKAYKQIY